jgi:HlyD family type I secretion membrane fusion protein
MQHPDGGVVQAINVRDGDHVEAGQVLLTLDGTRLRLALQTLRPMLSMNIAQSARLRAERSDRADIDFEGEAKSDIRIEEFPDILNGQIRLRQARRAALNGQIATLRSEGDQAHAAMEGLKQQALTQKARIQLLRPELEAAETLASTGSGTRNRVLQLGRQMMELQSELSSLEARASEADLKAKHADLDIDRARSSFIESVETELQTAKRERLETIEKLRSVSDQLERQELRAAVSGTVVNLTAHTVGGVITPGASVLEIVPDDDPLVVEAQVRPSDIEHLRPGLPVDIRLTGFDAKRLPRLTGTVSSISADRLIDRLRGTPYFQVRIQAAQTMKQINRELRPGMAVDVMIFTGEQTVVEYLVDPLLSFFTQSMRD